MNVLIVESDEKEKLRELLGEKANDGLMIVTPGEAMSMGKSIINCDIPDLSKLPPPPKPLELEYTGSPLLRPLKKEFICKGKHEYRERICGLWQCQCGQTL